MEQAGYNDANLIPDNENLMCRCLTSSLCRKIIIKTAEAFGVFAVIALTSQFISGGFAQTIRAISAGNNLKEVFHALYHGLGEGGVSGFVTGGISASVYFGFSLAIDLRCGNTRQDNESVRNAENTHNHIEPILLRE